MKSRKFSITCSKCKQEMIPTITKDGKEMYECPKCKRNIVLKEQKEGFLNINNTFNNL